MRGSVAVLEGEGADIMGRRFTAIRPFSSPSCRFRLVSVLLSRPTPDWDYPRYSCREPTIDNTPAPSTSHPCRIPQEWQAHLATLAIPLAVSCRCCRP